MPASEESRRREGQPRGHEDRPAAPQPGIELQGLLDDATGHGASVRSSPDLGDDHALELLASSVIEPVGVLTEASNLTLLVDLHERTGAPTGHRAVYKPVRGERPLHDFASGTLAAREVASYLVSRAAGFGIVPPTVLREGPLGVGSVQWWVEQEPERLADPSKGLVEVLTPAEVGAGWLPIVTGQDGEGRDVVVVHADDPRLRRMALLDAVLNNADRKAAHLALDPAGRLRGFDHGLCLHVHDKLRTVLWGWAGVPLDAAEMRLLEGLVGQLRGYAGQDRLTRVLGELLAEEEVEALRRRTEVLVATAVFPGLPTDRYPLPWPLW